MLRLDGSIQQVRCPDCLWPVTLATADWRARERTESGLWGELVCNRCGHTFVVMQKDARPAVDEARA